MHISSVVPALRALLGASAQKRDAAELTWKEPLWSSSSPCRVWIAFVCEYGSFLQVYTFQNFESAICILRYGLPWAQQLSAKDYQKL